VNGSNGLNVSIQEIANSKPFIGAGVGGATAKGWVGYVLTDPTFQAALVVVGLVLSLTLIAVQGFALWDRWKNR